MKKIKNLLFLILLLCPITVFASENKAKINDDEYPTVQSAIDVANENDEIVLLDDLSGSVSVPKEKKITIKLNSFNINNSIKNEGDLTIVGPGKLIASNSSMPKIVSNKEDAKMYLKNLEIEDNNSTETSAYLNNSGTLIIEDITYTADKTGVFLHNSKNSYVKIKSGNYTTSSFFIYDNYGTIDLDGGTYNFSAIVPIYNIDGTININNGTYTNSLDYALIDNSKNSILTINDGTFDVFHLAKNNNQYGEKDTGTVVNIRGGTINTRSYVVTADLCKDCIVNISGGKIISNTSDYIISSTTYPESSKLNITGGVIEAKNSKGIFISGDQSEIVIGTLDDEVSNDSPLIYINNGNFLEATNLKFYDGKIILTNEINVKNITTPDGYYVKYDDNKDNTLTAYLSKNTDPIPDTSVDDPKVEDNEIENPKTGQPSIYGIVLLIVVISSVLYYKSKKYNMFTKM